MELIIFAGVLLIWDENVVNLLSKGDKFFNGLNARHGSVESLSQ